MNKILLVLLLVSPVAWGYNYHVSWTAVTQRVDGTPVTVASYRVEYGWCATGSTKNSINVVGTVTDVYVDIPTDTYCWKAFAKDAAGTESQASNLVVFHEDSDSDGDGVADYADNCTRAHNPLQVDADADGFGNQCDADLNNDLQTNAQDYTLFRQLLGQLAPAPAYSIADLNANGFVNAQDYVLFRQLLGSPPGPRGAQ